MIARCDEAAEGWAPPPGADGDRDRVRELLAADEHFNEVAEVDGRIAGYANLNGHQGVARLSYLFVDPAYQGRGIGTGLMRRALDHARVLGYERAVLGTAVQNHPARRFYERAGWTDTGGRRCNDRLGLDMADYVLDLHATV